MRLNLHDRHTRRTLTIEPDLVHTSPWSDTRDIVLSFEAHRPDAADFPPDRLSLVDFDVLCHAGWIIRVRKHMPAPGAIYRDKAELTARVFQDYAESLILPPGDLRHPMLHIIPDGLPGGGKIVVRNISTFRFGPDRPASLSMIDTQKHQRKMTLQTLEALGYVLKGA